MRALKLRRFRFIVVKRFLRLTHPLASWRGLGSARSYGVIAVVTGAWLASTPARASDTTIYSNYANDLGTLGFLYQYSGSSNSPLFADDIYFPAAAANLTVNSIKFTLANQSNTSTVTITPNVEVFAFNAAGTPGLLLSAVTLPAVAVAPGADAVFTASGQNFFTVPANGKVWAGLYLTYTSASGGTGSFGQRAANPPTVGSSQAIYFVSTAAAVPGSNPSGGTLSASGGLNGTTNAQWAFSTAEIVPEPSSFILVAAGSVGLLCLGSHRTKATESRCPTPLSAHANRRAF